MARFTSSLFALAASLLALKQVQADVTVFQPVPTDPAFPNPGTGGQVIGVAPVAVASDGATQFAATEVATALTAEGTVIPLSSPTTFVLTFTEGASTYHISNAITTTIVGHAVALSDDVVCGPGNGDTLNCTEVAAVSFEGAPPTTTTVPFVASQSALFTITGSIAPLPTAKNGAMQAAPFMAATSILIGIVSGIAYIL